MMRRTIDRVLRKLRLRSAWSASSIALDRAYVCFPTEGYVKENGTPVPPTETLAKAQAMFGERASLNHLDNFIHIECRVRDVGKVLARLPGTFVFDKYDVAIEL